MNQYLLTISIGPVQNFIAAARRTRDLWFGSYILSEVSKAAAKFIHDQGATLIFPAPENVEMLLPDSGFSVTNYILALVRTNSNPANVAACAKAAAQQRWLDFASSAIQAAGKNVITMDIWNDQINDVLEMYSAWVPLDASGNKSPEKGPLYQEARERLDLILAGRKALRNFRSAKGRAGIPKSSLDGARESVLKLDIKDSKEIRRRIKVKRQEHLDSVGLVKRCAPLPGSNQDIEFVSVVRVAADPWIRGKAKTKEGRIFFQNIARFCHSDFAPKICSDVYAEFPYDATPLYLSRLSALKNDPDMSEHHKKLAEIEKLIRHKFGQTDQPLPYYSVLMADGDRIGATLQKMRNPDEHRKFSSCLSTFSQEARSIIETQQGCLVYSGGDDVLAFLPVDRCLDAAADLSTRFSKTLQPATHDLIDKPPTMSVGIAIGHCFDPLEDLLISAQTALEDAKTGQGTNCSDEHNGLSLHYLTRGAEAIRVRDSWNNDPKGRMERWIDLLKNNLISDGAVYDLHTLAGNYSGWQMDSLNKLIAKESERLLLKKKPAGKKLSSEVLDTFKREIKEIADLDRVARELLVARHMIPSYIQAKSKAKTIKQKNANKGANKEGGGSG